VSGEAACLQRHIPPLGGLSGIDQQTDCAGAGAAELYRGPGSGWLGRALWLLGAHDVQQDGLHIATYGQLVKPLHRQQRPLPAALPWLDNLNRHILLALGHFPDFLGEDIKGDRSLVLGVLVHNQLGGPLGSKAPLAPRAH
jgi:hypothetical protein